MLREGVDGLAAKLADWPATTVDTHSRTQAIPPKLQQRGPGLPGETIYDQTGYMCVVENLPASSYTLVAAAAVQVLARGRLRLHAVVTTERWGPNNEQAERWRATRECGTQDSEATVTQLLTELADQVGGLRTVFDQERGQASAE